MRLRIRESRPIRRALIALTMACVGLASISGVAVRAEAPTSSRSVADSVSSARCIHRHKPESEFFSDLERLESPLLAEQSASGLTDGELVLVVIFLIVFFPVGIILLIVFLVT